MTKYTYEELREGNRRLLVLANHLRTKVTPENFNMDVVGLREKLPRKILGIPLTKGEEEISACGSLGCMWGHAGFVPELQQLGLKPEWHGSKLRVTDTNSQNKWWPSPLKSADFFKLRLEESIELFWRHDAWDKHEKDVEWNACRLVKMVRRREANMPPEYRLTAEL